MIASGMAATLVTVPYHLGSARVGTGLGPERIARWALDDLPNRDLDVRPVELPTPFAHEVGATFALLGSLAEEVRIVGGRDRLPIVLAGDCITCLGTLAALESGRLGIVWFDAHGDLNTPDTTLTGFLDGMALAAAAGRCWRGLATAIPGFRPVAEENVVLVGGRAMDPAEADVVGLGLVTRVTETDVQSSGCREALGAAVGDLRSRVDRVYVHVDLDVLDPGQVAVNKWREPHGLVVDDLLGAIAVVVEALPVEAVGVASYDPTCDPDASARDLLRRLLGQLAGPPTASARAVD